MRFGKHTALVEEVVAFAFSDEVLSAVGPAEETDFALIVTDLRLALEFSGGEEVGLFQIAPEYDVSDWGNTELLGRNLINEGQSDLTIDAVRDELTWTWDDLTENLVAELIKTTEYWRRADRRSLHDAVFDQFCGSPLERLLRERFSAILPAAEPLPGWAHPAEQLANNILSELMWCAENRAFNGPTDNFWERLFRLYRTGFWPCGWQGVFPRPGKFVTYRRAC
jgi:hypothetical protein